MNYEVYFADYLKLIESELEKVLPPAKQHPSEIHEAMRYSVFPGGKRFRPILVLAVCEALGGKLEDALIPAASLELIHCYSLVHDDLPALDNDELRRGKPTCHKQFGEAMAILAGDGLLTHAFHILGLFPHADRVAKLVLAISTAAGTYGMIGGQVADIRTPSEGLSIPMLDYINSHKTGKLIMVGAVCGAISVGASEEIHQRIQKYGEFLGLAFQAVDDLHDGDGYKKLMGTSDLVEKIRDLIAKAKSEIRLLGNRAEKLHFLADFLLEQIPRGTHALDR